MTDQSTQANRRDRLGMTSDDWERQDAMTDEEITTAALDDPDNPPLTARDAAKIKPRPLSKVVRNELRLTREAFAARYGIPLDALTAWERHESDPTPTEITYLKLIQNHPEIANLGDAAE